MIGHEKFEPTDVGCYVIVASGVSRITKPSHRDPKHGLPAVKGKLQDSRTIPARAACVSR